MTVLNLPMEFYLLYTSDPSFIKNGLGMLKLWKELNEWDATVQKLTLLLIQNGHLFTAGARQLYIFLFHVQLH
jgi:hypothetical protein